MKIRKSKKGEIRLTKEEKRLLKGILAGSETPAVILLAIIMIREHYLPADEDGRVTWFNNFSLKLPDHSGTIAAITPAVLASVPADAAFYDYSIKLAKAATTFSEEITAFKDKVSFAEQGTVLGSIPSFNPPVPVTAVPAGIFTRLALLVDLIKSDGNYVDAIGQDLGIIGAENTVDTDNLVPLLKGKIVDGRFPNLKVPKKGMDAFNIYADYRDGQGMHWIARCTTFRRGFIDNHPLPQNVDSAVFDYQVKYVLKDVEVGQLSAKVSLTVTRQPV